MVALSLLGLLVGAAAGLIAVVFRMLTERLLFWLGMLPAIDDFESLPPVWRFALPAGAALLLGVIAQLLPVRMRAVGPTHVMARLSQGRGRLPAANAIWQFLAGGTSIIAGHAVGREGPVIHLGAATASLLGQWMRLPNNSIRTLVACGVAAAIGASFNTPLAGVIFAMEVVMLEYTLLGFAPVILASVSATAISQLAFGVGASLPLPQFQLASLLELPWIVFLGVAIGALAAFYVGGTVQLDRRTGRWPIAIRMTLAGIFVGACAQVVPEVMGLGYDTVQEAMLGRITLATLVMIMLVKLIATVVCGGLALPGGLIGPMIVIGACAGGAIGIVGHSLVPSAGVTPAFYATVGAVAMMGACLHAPLAALTAILELTGNPNTILPGMAAVMTAFLVARTVFRQRPLFIALLGNRGIDYHADPVDQALDRVGVAALMQTDLPQLDRLPGAEPMTLTAVCGRWQVTVDDTALQGIWLDGSPRETTARCARVPAFGTLGEALAAMDSTGADVALVMQGPVDLSSDPVRFPLPRRAVAGLIDRQTIDDWLYHRDA